MKLLSSLKKDQSPKTREKINRQKIFDLICVGTSSALFIASLLILEIISAVVFAVLCCALIIILINICFPNIFDRSRDDSSKNVFSVGKWSIIVRNNKVVRMYLKDTDKKWKKDISLDERDDYENGTKYENFLRDRKLVKHFAVGGSPFDPKMTVIIVFTPIEHIEEAQKYYDFYDRFRFENEGIFDTLSTTIISCFYDSIIEEVWRRINNPKPNEGKIDIFEDEKHVGCLNRKIDKIGIRIKTITWKRFDPKEVSDI